MIKGNNKISGLKIFNNNYLYTAYADDTTFFLKDLSSIRELLSVFNYFSTFSGLKPNISKCEVAGIDILKGVKVATCGFQCINLTKNAIKILGMYFSYERNIQLENNFKKIISKIENVLKIWRLRNLTLEDKIPTYLPVVLGPSIHIGG